MDNPLSNNVVNLHLQRPHQRRQHLSINDTLHSAMAGAETENQFCFVRRMARTLRRGGRITREQESRLIQIGQQK